jgi:hypothetical protein
VQFTRIHPDDSTDPVLSFDAGPAAAYYVDPDVAVDDDGRALVAFTDVGGTVRAVFISAAGVPGPVHALDASSAELAHVQAAFTHAGVPLVAWGGAGDRAPRVVAFDGSGNPGEIHVVPGPEGRAFLDVDGKPRLVWTRDHVDPPAARGAFSAPLGTDGAIGATTRLLPKTGPHGSYDRIAVAGGRLLALRASFGRVNDQAVVSARTSGRGKPVTLARRRVNNHAPGGGYFAHLSLAAGPNGRWLAAWTRRERRSGDVGNGLRGALIRGNRIGGRFDGDFAGRNVAAIGVTFSGRKPVVAAGDAVLRAAVLSAKGGIRDATRLPGSRSKQNEDLGLVPVGGSLRAVWQRGDRGNGGVIVTSRGRLR